MMKKMNRSDVETALKSFLAQSVYIHSEATSYVFVRNFRVNLTESFIAGEGPYRIGLRFDGHGWLRMEGLTHFEVDTNGRLLLAGYDDKGRMHVTLELGKEPFPA
jgi:Protein of unknown function (DUF1806)